MFVVTEIHPFTDGNGRIARIMMNAELDKADRSRVIIPTVFRDDYLSALRALTRGSNPVPYARMLDTAQRFTASLDFTGLQPMIERLHQRNAFLEPGEGRLKL